MKKTLCTLMCAMMMVQLFPMDVNAQETANAPEVAVESNEIAQGEETVANDSNEQLDQTEEEPQAIREESNDEAPTPEQVYDMDEASSENQANSSVAAASNTTLPGAVKNLKAVANGISSVRLTWDAVNGADGYIIYRQIGQGKFEYRYIVSKTNYTDTTAKTGEFNFYRVYAYKNINGERKVGASTSYVYAKPVPASATNLKATCTGTSSVKLTWNSVSDVDGYIIYRQIGNGKFEYRYIVKGTSFTDTTAKTGEYNYYRVYPYKLVDGKQIVGTSTTYVYSKPIPSAVTNLKISRNNYKGLTISWGKVANVDGYIIYRQKTGEDKFSYLGITTNGSYNDNNLYDSDYYFYRVYAYKKVDGKNVISNSTAYVYGQAHAEPDLYGSVSGETDYYCDYVPVYVENKGNKPVTFITQDAFLYDDDYYDYDRDLYLANGPYGSLVNAITIQPGQTKTLYYRVYGSETRYNKYSSVQVKFIYDGLTYTTDLSYYYGYEYQVVI